jgi:hypothetical protein
MHPLFKTHLWLTFAIVCLQLTVQEVFVIKRTFTIQTRRDGHNIWIALMRLTVMIIHIG